MIDPALVATPAALRHIRRHRGKNRDGDNFIPSLLADYELIRPFLPERVGTVLDIGCGMAGIDVLLKRHYPDAKLWLLDGDGTEPRDGWNAKLEAFSSRADADELLAANGIKADRWIDVNTHERLEADLVISLASWGYHYPLSTYDVGGFCIADLRKAKEEPRGTVIMDYPKRNRCAWRQ